MLITGACSPLSVGAGVPAAHVWLGPVGLEWWSSHCVLNVGRMHLTQFVSTLCPFGMVLFKAL